MLKDNMTRQNVTFWGAESIDETDEGHDISSNSNCLLTKLQD
jgi:hypothetical protein